MADRDAKGGTLIVGGGYAGSYVARKLGRHGATIVSPRLYQLRLPGKRLRVVTDWTVALFFRRDITELGVLERPRSLGG
jgi:2-polyprenyl-6-methoxyphenol hydroxylase-like FAD-dependent oxidoreductase